MFKEALGQAAGDGRPFVECLGERGILAGVKVDEGLEAMEGLEPETHTRGLETLAGRCDEYVSRGAKFAKWRAALRVGAAGGGARAMPSDACAARNAEELAEYAAVCQARGLCPIVEPELLIEGDHSARAFAEASQRVIAECTKALWAKGVRLEGALLKPQMMIPGQACAERLAPGDVAALTLDVMRRVVPAAVPGIMFLSGGQTEEEATVHLDALNRRARELGPGAAPWALSFSFGRALQAGVLRIWAADRSRRAEAQAMAAAVARANSLAALGRWADAGEAHPGAGGGSLVETFRGFTKH